LLTKKEAYRYAQPAATERKLQKLRVRATGQKRKTGPKDGAFATAKCQPGVATRTIKALAEVLAGEDLPAPTTPPPAETRTLAAAGLTGYAASLRRQQVVVRNHKRRATGRAPGASAGDSDTSAEGTRAEGMSTEGMSTHGPARGGVSAPAIKAK
jgi:transposase